ncbi:hypothetical protein Lal_00022165 [Lupinus albus]|nr:hypothetical protein Lal_00022165 [Lupinus albus]
MVLKNEKEKYITTTRIHPSSSEEIHFLSLPLMEESPPPPNSVQTRTPVMAVSSPAAATPSTAWISPAAAASTTAPSRPHHAQTVAAKLRGATRGSSVSDASPAVFSMACPGPNGSLERCSPSSSPHSRA